MPSRSLAELRSEIARTDRRLLEQIARRLELAREIGRLKRHEGRPLRDYPVERGVVDRWVRRLERSGVPSVRAEDVVRWMIDEAVYAQEGEFDPVLPPSRRSDVVVVGGLGHMGGWMREYFRATGHRVTVVDRRTPPGPVPFAVTTELGPAVAGAELVLVATPMRTAREVYRQVVSAGGTGTIADILSVKAPIVSEIRAARDAGRSVASLHPLFGPGARSLVGRNLLVVDCGVPRATRQVRELFDRSAVTLSEIALDEHDALMTDVLGLPHLLSLAFARALLAGGRTPEELGSRGTTTFRRISEVARVVTQENPELVSDIQTLNPFSPALFERLSTALADLSRAVESHDPRRYAALLEEGREFLSPTSAGSRRG